MKFRTLGILAVGGGDVFGRGDSVVAFALDSP